jgi:pimeloyl-ACP methyl ester carboxylesterase
VLALTGAGVAVADAADGGPGRDDWTGFLLVPAGLALCVLGGWLLWSSRKPGRYRFARRALIAVVAALAVYWVVFPAAFSIVATQKPRATIEAVDLGRPYEQVTLLTSDGLELVAWYVPSVNGAAVIAFPGRTGPVEHARMLARHGYGVLLLDMRGQGESEGDANAFGWGSAKDLDAAIAYLQARSDVEEGRIGGLGLSVGGEQLLEAAAGNPGLKAVVSEGAGWRSVRESFAREDVSVWQVWLQVPQDAVLTAATAVLSGDPPPPSLEDLVSRIAPRPVLFVYGEKDNGGERALTPAYYEAAAPPKQLWEVPGAGHTGGIDARPQEYERRIVAFFDAALLGSGSPNP